MQQRSCVFTLAILSTICAGSTALAGPLSLNQQSGGRAYAQQPGYGAPPAYQNEPPVRTAEAPRMGGGFFQFLFGGGRPQYQQAPAYAPGQDMGPGMVESPNAPGSVVMDPRYVKQEVSYDGRETAGTIIIDTRSRLLYLVQGGGTAIRYGIGVGRPGFTWSGVHHISQKREWPDWTPPPEMLRRRPDLPRHMPGGADNPLGARAMYLGSTLYRIHGSNEPWTIGTAVSSGCIRMRNEDVVDLYGRVKVGTKVVVI
jgi:lipoprotein-anchoring transpeptidase ErfK/SrfK